MSPGQRTFRALARLLPSDFRGDFGDAMTADLDRRDVRWWTQEIPGLLAAIVREHLDMLRQDVVYAFRLMRRTPGFTAIAILMLALGTGVNVAMFSVIDAVMLRSPFPRPDRLVRLRSAATEGRDPAPTARATYDEAWSRSGPLSAVAMAWGGSHVLTGLGDPRNFDDAECVSASMFDVLGTPPALGRALRADDDAPGAAPVIVLSHRFSKELGGDGVVGHVLTINEQPVTVVGVMPEGFDGALSRSDVPGWLPLSRPIVGRSNKGCPTTGSVMLFGRLAPGVSLANAQAAMPTIVLSSLDDDVLDGVRTPFFTLTAAVACVLLIACLNVGGLQTERLFARSHEIAVRRALGASGWRLARLLLTESALLAAAGAAAGAVLAVWTLHPLVALLPPNLPHLDAIAVDTRALLVAVAIGGVTTIAAALLPYAAMRRSWKYGMGTARGASPRVGLGRRLFVCAEIALSVAVLVGAGLLIQTFMTLRPTAPGFDARDKVTLAVRLRGETPEAARVFFPELMRRAADAPSVQAVTATTYVPMSGSTSIAYVTLEGVRTRIFGNVIEPSFFDVLHIPLMAGRAFDARESRGSEPAVIINELLARRLRPDGRLVGQRIAMSALNAPRSAPDESRVVIGIVANMRNTGGDLRPRLEAWVPQAQSDTPMLALIAHARDGRQAEAGQALVRAVHALRPEMVVPGPRPMQSDLDRGMLWPRLGASTLGLLAALATLLAAFGLSATMSWSVAQRARELAIRLALGATRRDVAQSVVMQGAVMVGAGIALGLALATALTRYMASWLYGVTPLDLATFLAVAIVVALVGLAAAYLPARRASRVAPSDVLRLE